jgi:hypothetical protein
MRRPQPTTQTGWWNAEEGQAHRAVFEYVSAVERNQFDIFDRFEKLEAIYDPNRGGGPDQLGLVTENVAASNVDTVTAGVGAAEIRARVMTDDGDWSTQRMAVHLEWYAEELQKLLKIPAKARMALKENVKKGTGLVKVYADQFKEIRIDHIRVDDLVVDEAECQDGQEPRQIHHRMPNASREQLKQEFPEHEEAIDRAQRGTVRWKTWAGYRPIRGDDQLIAIESWKLPMGKKGKKGYKPGRRTITIDGCDLLDEKYEKTHFPIADLRYSKRSYGWYGISLTERIAGLQRALNRRNFQIERILDQSAYLTTYVRPADAALTTRTSRIGAVSVIRGDYPQTPNPPLVSPETYQDTERLSAKAYRLSGVSQLSSQGLKPAGLDSGAALREYKDQSTSLFSPQESDYEAFVLHIVWLAIDVCKDLGDDAPTVARKTKFGAKKIPWAQVDMQDVAVQLVAASNLSRTPAGRQQTVIEWAQAGIVSPDDARRLMEHPDLEAAMSLYTAALEDIEDCIEEILDGKPFQNLKLGVWRFQMAYLKAKGDGAPEEILDALRDWITQATWILNRGAQAANQNAAVDASGTPMQPAAGGAPMPQDPGGQMAAAPGGVPQAALAAQAMQLRAG